ncbi:MAG TPA: ATP-binding protein [Sphingomonas sp.]|nr:ATP-binding protein [Sphingomonas sp.]
MRIESLRRYTTIPAIASVVMLALIAIFALGGWSIGDPAAGKAISTLDYGEVDISFSDQATIPAGDWHPGKLPDFRLLRAAKARGSDPPHVWVRARFDRTPFGDQPLALHTEMVRDSYTVYLNGTELYRSRADSSDQSFSWNRPLYVPLPPAMLRPGGNEIVFRIETLAPNLLGLGALHVGPDRAVRTGFNGQLFLSNIAPQIVSGYLLILTIGALSFWVKRPKDHVYGWLALVGLTWLFRNLQYFVQEPPIERVLFWTASTDAIFVLMAAVFAFAAAYFALPRARLIQGAIFGLCALEIFVRHQLVAADRSELPSFLLTIPMTTAMIILLLWTCVRKPTSQHWMMFGAILLSLTFSFHDMLFSFNVSRGAGLFLQPFGGLAIFAAFDVALTSRLQTALIDVEDVNLKLEARVAEITDSLAESEKARAQLQIAHAVDGERERMMREIHDGIGSSLLTALAQARRRNESPETIATLARSLTDLRIGVDSLEPIDGDVVALLANLRHRMERELKGAGLRFVWKVEAAPPLPWLDPIGALHILRILQETISNSLRHSEGATIVVRCGPSIRDRVEGILIEIADNGTGFEPASTSRGKGLANMAARAEALNAIFSCTSAIGAGTTVSIWLPLERPLVEIDEPAS